MKKAYLVVAALAVLVVVLLVIPYFFNLESYRLEIVEQIKQITGREVQIEGLQLSLLPRVGVVVSTVRIKNPSGFPEGETVAVEKVHSGLALLPLLSKQVEISSVTVRGVQVNLLANDRGQTNYESLLKSPLASAEEAEEGESSSRVSLTRVDAVAVEDVQLTSGSFRRAKKRVYPRWAVSGVNLEARGFDFNDSQWMSKVRAEMDLSTIEISSPVLKQPLRVTDGEVRVKGNEAEGDFELRLGSLRAGGTLKVPDLEHPVADFTLAAKELNLADLSTVLGKAPKGAPKTPPTRIGRVLLARGTVEVEQVVLPPLIVQNLQGENTALRQSPGG